MLKKWKNGPQIDVEIEGFSICLRKGDFAKLCTTLERELGSEGLGVPKFEEKWEETYAKKMLENMMQKS